MFIRQTFIGRALSQIAVLLSIVLVALPLVMIGWQSLQGQGGLNYLVVLTGTPFVTFIGNSLVIAVATVAIVLVCSLAGAFAIELLRPRGSRLMLALLLGGLTLPAVALIAPLFTIIQSLQLDNTHWAVILPQAAIALPFGVLLCSNYIRGLPIEVWEAARIDGAGTVRFFVSILVPLARPILFVIAVFTFLGAWNEYVLPLLFLQAPDLRVATQVPTYFASERRMDLPKIFAANILISIPVVVLYLLTQSQFRRGLSGGAVK
ncbi:carbohydrate ABC transporter permease [Microbacterium sp. 4R-513]|uniref:carbohydrate ABC transporter permease n=1 Tax=Microbacterium sp. 4R-513 TaxID=2567934 RepID=UPI0013E109CF|nr:carbohydrate ABC transporter permease [Microbacterium sp. 4R-513]QIG39379.1 carbohydrate ABC transporter permease [Microbacterium sp. 4R-513]